MTQPYPDSPNVRAYPAEKKLIQQNKQWNEKEPDTLRRLLKALKRFMGAKTK